MAKWMIHGNSIKTSVRLYMQEPMYNIQLTKERLMIYVAGLDSGIKLISQQLSQGNSALVLKQFLPKLIEIDRELQYLDKLIDEVEGKKNA